MASLIIASGAREGDYYPLTDQTVVVGRDAKCPIQIVDDERISRVHLQINLDPAEGGFCAEDLKSANGVVVNNARINGRIRLGNGDLIIIGDTKLVFFDRDFPDRKSAWDYYKIAGERGRPTMM